MLLLKPILQSPYNGWSTPSKKERILKYLFPEQCPQVTPVIFELQARINGQKRKRIFATLLLYCTNEAVINFSNGEGTCALSFAGCTNDLLRTRVFNVSKE